MSGYNKQLIVQDDLGSLPTHLLAINYNKIRSGKAVQDIGVRQVSGTDVITSIAATDDVTDFPLLTVAEKHGIYIDDVQFSVGVAIVADATDIVDFGLGVRLTGGVSTTALASASSVTTDLNGVAAFTPVSMRDEGGTVLAAPYWLPQNSTLMFSVTQGASGRVVTGLSVTVHYRIKDDDVVLSPPIKTGLAHSKELPELV